MINVQVRSAPTTELLGTKECSHPQVSKNTGAGLYNIIQQWARSMGVATRANIMVPQVFVMLMGFSIMHN